MIGRATSHRLAPSAPRTAISRRRLDSRASSRLAMLAQTISSRNPTAPISTINAGRDAPTSCSCAATTRAFHPALLSLNSVAIALASTADFFLRLLRRDSAGHPADHRQRSRPPRSAVHVFRIERQRRPRFHVGAGREFERRRHHADDGVGHGVELDRLPHYSTHPPASARDQKPWLSTTTRSAPTTASSRGKRAPERGVALEHGEQVRRRAAAPARSADRRCP